MSSSMPRLTIALLAVALVAATVAIVQAHSAQSELAAQAETIAKLRTELAHAQTVAGEVAAVQRELDKQRASISAVQESVVALEGHGRQAARRGLRQRGTVRDLDGTPRDGAEMLPATDEDETIDVLTAEVAQRLADSPALQANAQVDQEAVRALVADVEQQHRRAREERRRAKRVEGIKKQAQRYAQTLALNGSQSAALERILLDSSERARDVRERAREGEIGWSDARREWESIHDEVERNIEGELGPELAGQVAEMRADDEPWGRGRGQRGGRTSGTTNPP